MRKGSKQTEEAKAKIREAKRGVKFTPEHSQKIKKALTGQTKTKEHIAAIAASVKKTLADRKFLKSIDALAAAENEGFSVNDSEDTNV